MKKCVSFVLVILSLLLCFSAAAAAESGVRVYWNMDAISSGELSASVANAEEGKTIILAVYDGNILVGVKTAAVENSAVLTPISIDVEEVSEESRAALFLWDMETLSPVGGVLSTITPEGITPRIYGAVEGTVWADNDLDGNFGEGEGISDAIVTLTGGDETITTTTDEDGAFSFSDVPAGEYVVSVSDPLNRTPLEETQKTVTVAIYEATAVSFGFRPLPGSVGGLVWIDANRNGEIDDGESPLSGAKVSISGVDKTAYINGGAYKFDELDPGTYSVSVTAPEGYECTTGSAVVDIEIAPGKKTELNFGFAPMPGSISGVVWVDSNRNGAWDEDEETIPGTAVIVSGMDQPVITDETGRYSFEALEPGSYSVSAASPGEEYMLTTDSEPVALGPGEKLEINIGFALKPGSITGIVWLDEDGDGLLGENESGLAGVTVMRSVGETSGMPEAVTAEDGSYSFSELNPGTYTVTVTLPINMEAASGESSVEVTVEPGAAIAADFILVRSTAPGNIEGLVWNDDNENGIQDDGESIVRFIAVTITSADGTRKTAYTGFWGEYSFTDVAPGEYTLECADSGSRRAANNPRTITVISGTTISEDFGLRQLWVSDNQRQNKSDSVAYHSIDPALGGDYTVTFDFTLNTNGDNAILLGDSSNGNLEYSTASATLLFTGDGNFSVRNGNGKGQYTSDAVRLCGVSIGETYTISFKGNITANTYTVSITDQNGETYTSGELHARANGSKIDTIALISNNHNTTNRNGTYSNYYFYIENFEASGDVVTEEPDEPEEPGDAEYNGFAGMYYGITVNGRYIRGNNGRITADYTSVRDESAQFLPRDMADGTFALLCRSSNRRITTTSLGSQLTSGEYATNDKTQHWILEPGPSYSDSTPAYYLKSADNGMYIGLSGSNLVAVSEANKVELVFNPLPEESPLYQVSRTAAYAKLTPAQRNRIITFYETVAGDVFGRYGGSDFEWGVRGRLDAAFEEILSGNLSADAQYQRLLGMLSNDNGYLIQNGNIPSYTVSTSLPGTENLTYKLDEGEYGNYDFWRGTMLDGTRYNLSIYNGEKLEQTIQLYVQDDGTTRQNSDTFLKVITKIPYIYRRNIRTVKMRSDSANSFNCGASDLYIRINWYMSNQNQMLGTLTHELNHSLDQTNGSWSHGAPWSAAMAADMIMATEYARTSVDEDFAEFGRLYVLCYGNQDRQKALQLLFPNRYASYWRLRNNNLGGFQLWEDTEYIK